MATRMAPQTWILTGSAEDVVAAGRRRRVTA
jgi:hypothetical protein